MTTEIPFGRDPELTKFYTESHDAMINYCIAKGMTRARAEDTVSEAFARLCGQWEMISERPVRENKKLMYNLICSIVTEERKISRSQLTLDSLELAFQDDTIGKSIEDIRYAELVNEIAARLGEPDGTIFIDRYAKNLTNAEIADDTGMREGTIRTRISRLRKKLRGIINDLRDEGQFME